jgi:uncharacterized protein (TIGR03067 family)
MHRVIQSLAAGLSLVATLALAEDPAANELVRVRGTWTVTAAEQGGKPFDAIVGGVLKIDGAAFVLRTARGTQLDGQLRLDPASSPKHIDFLLSTGAVWEGIYTTSGDFFRLNYVERGDAPRPTVFATTADMLGTVIILRRQDSTAE